MGSVVERSVNAGVHRVVLDAQENRNALSFAVLESLSDAAAAATTDPTCRAMLLTHRGSVFCAGVDLSERRNLAPGRTTHSELLAHLLRDLWEVPVPLVCAVDGAVRGGGMGLLSCADVVIASGGSSFAYSEVRVGVAPALVGAFAMAQTGSRSLLPWLLRGQIFDSATAERLAVVHEVSDDVEAATRSVLDDLRWGGPTAVRTTKQLARRFVAENVGTLVDEMAQLSAGLFDSEEAREGMAAFADRRSPSWAVPTD